MSKKNNNQYEVDFGKEKIDTSIIIEFPVHLKNKKENLFWRYHIDGKYELISFSKNGASFTFDKNNAWTDSEKMFDKIFMIRQLQNNILISEDVFISKMKEFFDIHQKFIGIHNDIIIDNNTNNEDF